MASKHLGGRTVKIEQVSCYVTCAACGETYNIRMKRSVFQHNCRCGRAFFAFSVGGTKERVTVNVIHCDNVGTPLPFTLTDENIEIAEDN